jgi:hypothetical protein
VLILRKLETLRGGDGKQERWRYGSGGEGGKGREEREEKRGEMVVGNVAYICHWGDRRRWFISSFFGAKMYNSTQQNVPLVTV